jgi:hypothetical protein
MQASEILCDETPELNNLSRLRVRRGPPATRPQIQEQPVATPKDLPDRSDVTAQAPKTMTVTGVSSYQPSRRLAANAG